MEKGLSERSEVETHMARIYRYVDTSEKSGYFIIGDDGNATFQLTEIARRLFDEIGYEPPTKPEGKGPRVPSALHWALYEIGWIYTGDDDAGPINKEERTLREDIDESMTDEMVTKIKRFIKERNRNDVMELAHRLDLETEKDRLSTLSDQKQSALEDYVYGYMETILTDIEEENIESLDVIYLDLTTDLGSLNVVVETIEGESNFRHTISADSESGVSGVVSATEASQSWIERGRLDKHRGHLFEAISRVSEDPTIELDFYDDELNEDISYNTSFDTKIQTG